MITELELKNFRGFGQLQLTGLGPVNLVVGMNNVGKTSLLEAVSLLGGEGSPSEFHRLYRDTPDALRDTFFDLIAKDSKTEGAACYVVAKNTNGRDQGIFFSSEREPVRDVPKNRDFGGFRGTTRLGNLHLTLYGLGSDVFKSRAATNGLRKHDRQLTLLSKLLESGDREEQLIEMLKALDERVDAVRILSQNNQSYVAIGFDKKQRIPVSHAGQGMERVIAIFSEILGEKADIVCIDEIENGLHHTALRRIWEGIAEIATRLGVQLFITTHSRECLEAAHWVFEERAHYDLRVVQLYRVRGELDGRVLGRDLIEAAVQSEIEVR